MENVKNLLESAGTSMANVIKTTVFIKDMGEFTKINEIYARYFEGDCPGTFLCGGCQTAERCPDGDGRIALK